MILEKEERLYLRIGLGVEASSSGLAESYFDGRVSPRERLRQGNRELTFAQAVREDAVLQRLVGDLPSEAKPAHRTWREERRFRREAWRRIVREGDLSIVPYLDRIEEGEAELASVKEAAAESARQLDRTTMVADRLTAALENGAENLETFSIVLSRAADRSAEREGSDAGTESGLRVLSGLTDELATRLRRVSARPGVRLPDAERRIDEIEEFRRATLSEIEEARKANASEERRIADYKTKVLSTIGTEEAAAKRRVLDASRSAMDALDRTIRDCARQRAVAGRFIGRIDELVSRYIPDNVRRIRRRDSLPRADVVKALAMFAPSVSFDRVLALYDGSWFGRLDAGILLAPDGIHLSNGNAPTFLPWSEDVELSSEGALFGKSIRFGERIVGQLPHASAGSVEAFLSGVNAIAKSLPEPAFVREGLEAIATVAETVFDSPAAGEA